MSDIQFESLQIGPAQYRHQSSIESLVQEYTALKDSMYDKHTVDAVWAYFLNKLGSNDEVDDVLDNYEAQYDHTIDVLTGDHEDLNMDSCTVYIVTARDAPTSTLLMGMTVWMVDNNFQEHVFIVSNILVDTDVVQLGENRRPKGLSLLLHSFAAATFNRPYVCCQPLSSMRSILEKAFDDGLIDIDDSVDTRSLYNRSRKHCRVYRADLFLHNNSKLQGLYNNLTPPHIDL